MSTESDIRDTQPMDEFPDIMLEQTPSLRDTQVTPRVPIEPGFLDLPRLTQNDVIWGIDLNRIETLTTIDNLDMSQASYLWKIAIQQQILVSALASVQHLSFHDIETINNSVDEAARAAIEVMYALSRECKTTTSFDNKLTILTNSLNMVDIEVAEQSGFALVQEVKQIADGLERSLKRSVNPRDKSGSQSVVALHLRNIAETIIGQLRSEWSGGYRLPSTDEQRAASGEQLLLLIQKLTEKQV